MFDINAIKEIVEVYFIIQKVKCFLIDNNIRCGFRIMYLSKRSNYTNV